MSPRSLSAGTGGAAVRCRRTGSWPARVALALALLLTAFYLAGPPIWMLISALSPDRELLAKPPHWIPAHPTLHNLQDLLATVPPDPRAVELTGVRYFKQGIVTSLLLCLGVIGVTITAGSLSAYSLVRMVSARWRGLLMIGLLTTRMIPLTTVVIPMYIIAQRLGLLDSLTGLIIAYSGLLLPFAIWLLAIYFQGVPQEIEEAALIDGCAPLRALVQITMPLAGPGIFATIAFVFISTWTDLLIGLVLTNNPAHQPLPVLVSLFASGMAVDTPWGLTNAAGLLAMILPVGLGLVFRRYVMLREFTAGAIK